MATKIDGKMISARIKEDLARRVAALKQRGVEPGLATILVGSDPGSVKYVAGKHADCAEIGVTSIKRELPADATFDQIAAAVNELNADPACTGYIVQLPLPKGIDENAVIDLIDPKKACIPTIWASWCCIPVARSPRRCRARHVASSNCLEPMTSI